MEILVALFLFYAFLRGTAKVNTVLLWWKCSNIRACACIIQLLPRRSAWNARIWTVLKKSPAPSYVFVVLGFTKRLLKIIATNEPKLKFFAGVRLGLFVRSLPVELRPLVPTSHVIINHRRNTPYQIESNWWATRDRHMRVTQRRTLFMKLMV